MPEVHGTAQPRGRTSACYWLQQRLRRRLQNGKHVFYSMTDEEQDYVIDCIEQISMLGHFRETEKVKSS